MALAAAILGFAPGLLEPFHPLKAVYLRAIGMALLGWVLIETWAGRLRRPGLLGFTALAWAAAVALSTLTAQSPRLAWLGEPSQREGLLTAIALVGLHLGATHAHQGERQVRGTLLVVLACACAAAVYAQLQAAGLDPLHAQGQHTFTAQGVTSIRPGGPLGNPVLLGAMLAGALPIAVLLLADEREDAAWFVPAAALLAATLLVTMSRGAWLAGAVGVSVTAVLALLAGGRPGRVVWTLAASFSPALAITLVRSSAPVAARLREGLDSHSIASRAGITRGAVQMWGEHPWTGVGPDGFGVAFTRVQEPEFWRQEWIGAPAHAHSVPLQTLATLGAVGVLAGLAWLATALLAQRRAWSTAPASRRVLAGIAGTTAALCVAGTVNVVGLAGAALFAVVTALSAAFEPRRAPALASGMRAHVAPFAPWVAAGLCLAELVAGTRELGAFALAAPARAASNGAGLTPSEWRAVSESRADRAWRALRAWDGDDLLWRVASEASLVSARAAGAIPGDSLAAGSEEAAEHAARRAVSLVPLRASCRLGLAQALAARALRSGDPALADSATRAFLLAELVAPCDGWLLVAHARFQLARRDGVRALEVAQRIVGLYPEAAVGHTLAGGALVLLARPDDARAELLAARNARWEEDAGAQRAAVEALLERLPAKAAAAAPERRRGSTTARR